MDWEGIATIAYFNALWGFMGYLYTTLEIQEFLMCFLEGMFFSLAVAVLVGLYRLNHAPTSRTAHTRLNRRLLRLWAPATVCCSAGTHVVLIWRKCSPLLHPDVRKAVSGSTGNLVLVFAVLTISSACVSAIVLAIISFVGHLSNKSLSWAQVANADDWAVTLFEPLEIKSVSVFRPAWDVWTFATTALAFFLGPWLALRAGNAFGLIPASPNLDQMLQLVNRMPNVPNAPDERDASRPPDNTFPPPPASTSSASPPRASSSKRQLEDNDVPCLSLQNNVKEKEKERKEGNRGKGNGKGKGKATRD
ncbi:BZ3500_MvSof-1268-A1-R1_Chr6-3g09015 [Microbotryum saponariae]|uniref:BZ3500_MvSof-1268-A1-R1_Chr6-3g09015 protein n=1 Tax=Microbotryum saponariae TaxID=289078 RepID=A0A2X0NPA4_9BASI|nr:BZ3500_MvSof-1268-A1-R1_Chr6-3g09015 [Microbotryum saponariae]SDA07617.1 BZ3501_MvSof-1269-A2-R1_Chr6-2g08719 [Microbotryum saponariae]